MTTRCFLLPILFLAISGPEALAQIRGGFRPPPPPVAVVRPSVPVRPAPVVTPKPPPPVTPPRVNPNLLGGSMPTPPAAGLTWAPKPPKPVKPGGPYSVLEQHHTFPKGMGNNMPRGSYGLTPLSPAAHKDVHNAMRQFFRNKPEFWKTRPDGRRVNLYPLPGQKPGTNLQAFTLRERLRGLDSVYRQYKGGKLVDNFRRESQLANGAKKLK